MSRTRWLIVGVAAFTFGCATGTSDDGDGEDAGAPDSAAQNDATANADANGAQSGEDSGEDTASPGADSTAPPGDDDAPTTGGDDTGTGTDGSENDANEQDAEGEHDAAGLDANEHDANEADANEHDAGEADANDASIHDASIADSGEDARDANEPDSADAHGIVDANLPDTSVNAPDTGSGVVDAGVDSACAPPGTVVSTNTVHTPPTNTHACTASAAQAFYDDCFAGSASSCNSWVAANAACDTCLEGSSDPSDTAWGPFVLWPAAGGIADIDLGGCLIVEGKSTNEVTCGKDFQYLDECENAECDVSCSGGASGLDDYQTCAAAADKGACLTQYDAVNGGAACNTTTVEHSSCLGNPADGGTGTFETQFLAVAALLCE